MFINSSENNNNNNILGIICEYNPFHKAHKYHIEKSKEVTKSKYVVCVMSGNFVQRGTPALFDKYLRTKLAILSGVDVVLELPIYSATASSEFFASGSVNTLYNTGIVNSICFGSESGEIDKLISISKFLYNEDTNYKTNLKIFLDEGNSFPLARELAIKSCGIDIPNLPNDILGIEYIKSIMKISNNLDIFPIKPFCIKREISNYHDKQMVGEFSSASSIRNVINDIISNNSSNFDILKNCLPENSLNIVIDEIKNGNFADYNKMLSNFFYNISISNVEVLKEFMDVTEGLENRLKTLGLNLNSFDEIIKTVKSKRYTYTKISRMILHILLQMKKSEFEEFHSFPNKLPYIRVLGFKKESSHLLSSIIENAKVPVITNLKNAEKILDKKSMFFLEKEIITTDIYNLMLYKNNNERKFNYEFTKPLVII